MKKKRKYQDQQIILNQDIPIKYYSNYLIFFVINSFRIKYYYKYANCLIFFKMFKFMIRNFFNSNLIYNRLFSNFSINIKFFKFYNSLLLYKFAINKNFFLDKTNVYHYTKFNSLKSNFFFNNYNFLYSNNNLDTSVDFFGDLKYLFKNNIFYENLLFQLYFSLDLFKILNYNQLLQLYKLYILFILNNIYIYNT